MILFDCSILSTVCVSLSYGISSRMSHSMKPLKESMVQRKACTLMTPFGPNRRMDASTAALFLSAYHMQKKFPLSGKLHLDDDIQKNDLIFQVQSQIVALPSCCSCSVSIDIHMCKAL